MTVSDTFRAAASQFANELQASFASHQRAQPEDQLKGPVQALLRAIRQQVRTKPRSMWTSWGADQTSASRWASCCAAMSS